MQRKPFSATDIMSRRTPAQQQHFPKMLIPRGGQDLIVSCGFYHQGQRQADVSDIPTALETARKTGGFVWLGLWEPTDEEFADIAEQFDLPALAVEDAVSAHQRPKLERYGNDLLFVIVKPVHYIDRIEVVEVAELAVFVAANFIITVRHGRSEIPALARANLDKSPGRLVAGPGAVLHEIMDLAVDDYLQTVASIEVDIDEIEDQVFGGDRGDHSERIYKLKREVLEFRRAAAPIVPPLFALSERQNFGLSEDIRLLFRDVHDHAIRAAEEIESFNALLTDALQAELAQVSVRQNEASAQQNEDMRKISAWAAIGLVPTAFAGVYGMNFDNMPELHWHYGYFMLLGAILTSCVGLYVMFRRNGWL